MVSRRAFFQTASVLSGSLGMIDPTPVFADAAKSAGYFGVHPFVELHPEAVFILRTHVDRKTNSDACMRVGLDFGRTVFVPMDKTGIPVSHNIATKPNLTAHQAMDERRGFTLEDTMGIATDVFFVEGLFESLKDLGVAGSKMHMRDANGSGVIEPRGYVAMSQRVGGTVAPAKNRIETIADANDASAVGLERGPRRRRAHTDPLLVAVQCAGFLEPERGEIQSSRHGLGYSCSTSEHAY